MEIRHTFRIRVVKGSPALKIAKGETYHVETLKYGPENGHATRYMLRKTPGSPVHAVLWSRSRRAGEFNLNNGNPTKFIRVYVLEPAKVQPCETA